jgi:L-fuculose-phosphate aldolase
VRAPVAADPGDDDVARLSQERLDLVDCYHPLTLSAPLRAPKVVRMAERAGKTSSVSVQRRWLPSTTQRQLNSTAFAARGKGAMDKDLAGQVVDIAQRVVASGAISANGHGNVSVRVSGAAEMYFTAGPSLRDHPASAVVRVGLDGTLIEGELPPIQGAVVAMHTAMYADHPDVGCVLHTHSPFATAYAVAHRPIGCWVEALAMFGLAAGVPVAGYGPRGSEQAVAGIRAAVTPGVPAVLLANHGVLVFHRTPELAILVGGVVEEAAQAGINAAALGGPVEIPAELRAAALQRAMSFDSRGTVRA